MQLPTMQSNHCQMRVMSAVQSVEGVKVLDIQPGKAEVEVDSEEQQIGMVKAIEKAGYTIAGVEIAEKDAATDTLRFKTNINCNGCLTKVTPFLEGAKGIVDWNVDLLSAEKTLTVNSNGISQDEIKDAVKKAGFNADQMA